MVVKKQSGKQQQKTTTLSPCQLDYLKAVEEWKTTTRSSCCDNLYSLLKDVVNDGKSKYDDSFFASFSSGTNTTNNNPPVQEHDNNSRRLDELVPTIILEELNSLYEEYTFATAKDASLTDELRYEIDDNDNDDNQQTYSEDSLVYGEIDLKGFGQLLQEILQMPQPSTEGEEGQGSKFYDLGSGSGRAVFAARYHGDFTTCVGIELLGNLHQLGQSVHSLYKFQNYRQKLKWQAVEFIHSDLLAVDNWWKDGTIVYVPNLLFDDNLMIQIATKAIRMQQGAYLMSLKKFFSTKTATTTEAEATEAAAAATEEEKDVEKVKKEFHNAFELILQRAVPMSWGESNVYVYRKKLPTTR